VALGGLPSLSTIDTNNGAGAVDFGVLGHHLALLMVLVFGMGACADGADNSVLWTWATRNVMPECPTVHTL